MSDEKIRKAIKLCTEYNWHDLTSMRFALDNIKNFLTENLENEEDNS